MYSDKENINLLTAALLAHAVRCAVVCPGSRNAAIVHNLCQAGIECHPVTDERSAAFYALGLALARRSPVAVCVTSGTALLNTLPAVAEAYYQHVPLIVISADRPAWAIGQLQGQTLPQPGALTKFVGKCVDLPEVHDKATRKHCARLANEALCEMTRHHAKPVHINVPISEPLFGFNTPGLPTINKITLYSPCENPMSGHIVREYLSKSQRPMLVVGQCAPTEIDEDVISRISARMTVLHEPLSIGDGYGIIDDAIGEIGNDERYAPDLIIYVGDTIVSNKLRKYLASVPDAISIVVNADGDIHDVLGNVSAVVDDSISHFLRVLGDEAQISTGDSSLTLRDLWLGMTIRCHGRYEMAELEYGELMVVKSFEQALADEKDIAVHYANSSAVRYASIWSRHYVYVNRGANGIEGSLSTAAGFSLGSGCKTFCVIGDLSFFYDCNALWNVEIGSGLRVLLLNNSGGKIFDTLPGLSGSAAYPGFVAGTHSATAHGVCESYGIDFRQCAGKDTLAECIEWLVHSDSARPKVLECVF